MARWSLESEIADRENIRLARIAPQVHPETCATRYVHAVRQVIPPNAASMNEITGLKCAPEIGPKVAMMTNSPNPVAAAFSKSSRPIAWGEYVGRRSPNR